MKNQLFLQIMADKANYPEFDNLESQISDLENNPESWVNSVSDTSYDEMSPQDQQQAVLGIRTALEQHYQDRQDG